MSACIQAQANHKANHKAKDWMGGRKTIKNAEFEARLRDLKTKKNTPKQQATTYNDLGQAYLADIDLKIKGTAFIALGNLAVIAGLIGMVGAVMGDITSATMMAGGIEVAVIDIAMLVDRGILSLRKSELNRDLTEEYVLTTLQQTAMNPKYKELFESQSTSQGEEASS